MLETVIRPSVRSRPGAESDAPVGFVQLPTDTQRSSAISYRRAWIDGRSIAGYTGESHAALVGALSAVLFRYTQQSSVVLDVYAHSADIGGRTRLAVNILIPPDGTLQDAMAFAASTMVELQAGSPSQQRGIAGSNIALSRAPAGEEPGWTIDASDRHEVHFVVQADSAVLHCAYNAGLFAPATIDRLADAVMRAFHLAIATPATPIAELPILSNEDLRTIIGDWHSGHADYPREPVHRIFERLAGQQPGATALRFEQQSLTYGELETRANRLAHHLLAHGVRPGGAVAVCVAPSFDIAVAFLAIWKAGGVYVPLDPAHPPALIAAILDDVGPSLVLTQSALKPLTDSRPYEQFCFDTDSKLLDSRSAAVPEVHTSLDDRAYVLYTSGTTGKPKGVDAIHGNLAHYIHVARQKYRFGAGDVFCSLARYTFSISLFELVSPLCCGGSLRLLGRDDVLAPNRLTGWLGEVTVIHAGPSLLGTLFRYLRTSSPGGQVFTRMRHASSGGDLVPPTIMEEMKTVFPAAELFVIYGCTEISCMGCTYPISREVRTARTFVGKPFADVAARVTDAEGKLMPIGAVGEICFAGAGIVRGYLRRSDLTAEKFINREGMRFYRTGDMGRLHSDGNIEILGRRDYQVQLRGIRVELPGIENTIREIGLAEQCAVVMKKLDEQDVRLIAFVVGPRESAIAGFRRALSAHLPDYMLPQALVVLPALPVTRNGKLDRSALQLLPWEPTASDPSRTPPRTPLERQIAEAFARVLGISEVGIDDDFFDLGGHSLLAVSLLLELENVLGLNLPPGVLFERPTVRALAEQAQAPVTHIIRPVPLSAARDKPAVFMVLGVQLYKALARRLENDYAVFGVYSGRELENLEHSEEPLTVPSLASDYVKIIRLQQPIGPYRIGGVSFGGIVAYEVAQQLRAAGEQVLFVGMIDAVLLELGMRHRLAQLARAFTLPPGVLLRAAMDRLQKRLPRLFGWRQKSEFLRYAAQERIGSIEELRQDAYADAVLAYGPALRPFAGRIELIVAGRRLARDPLLPPDSGWRRHARFVNLHVLDGDHFDLVEEPIVAEVAGIFLKALRSAEAKAILPERAGEGAKITELAGV